MKHLLVVVVGMCMAVPMLAQDAPQGPSQVGTASVPEQAKQKVQDHVDASRSNAAEQQAQAAAGAQSATATPEQGKPVVLDSVVAIINGDVILESDVEAERRFESLQLLAAGENTDARAAQHLITRTLILQQMKEQDQASPDITNADVDKFVDELKKQQPGCAHGQCATAAEWATYLSNRGLSPEEVKQRWRERLVILNYVNLRFRQGIRIPASEVQAYYDKNLVPQFQAKHQAAPAIKQLKPRIEEILLQQAVSTQMDDWESMLRQEGSVQILVPAYGQTNAKGQESDDLPGGGA